MSGRVVDAAESIGDYTFNGEHLVVAKLPELALAAILPAGHRCSAG